MLLQVTVEHSFRQFTIAATFEAPAEGITVLFGPSGAGKSTVLAAIAGLIRTDGIHIALSGELLHRLPPERRRMGVVFQDGRLFPHMSVRENLLYGLKRAPAGPIFIDETLELLGLEKLQRRRPATLSGGERQRVAIGRALLSQPRMLLMDEPLASLDDARRAEILPYLARLRDKLRMPIVYVTHNMKEAVLLADQMVLMENGRVLAAGPLADLAARVDLPLAARDDAAGVLNGYLHSHDYERRLSSIACGGQIYMVPLANIEPRTPVRLRVPAREVILALDAPQEISVNNVIPATVCGIGEDAVGHAALVEIDVGGGVLLARITLDAAERLRLRPGGKVLALIKSMGVEMLG
jgi:molybdate transport system ATP-binding protein